MAESRSSASADIKQLRSTVEFINCLSQGGFSEINAIAKLALAYLERPECYRNPEVIALALSAIWGTAESIENSINSEAERIGCNFTDEARARRVEARLNFSSKG